MIDRDTILAMQAEISNSIRSLNNGGCIHFAYYFSKALRKADIPHKIVFTNSEYIHTSYKYFSSVAHVLVNIPNIGLIDGYELFNSKQEYANFWEGERYIRQYNFSEKKLDNFRNNYRWNPQYRTKQNVKLEKIINKHINGTRGTVRKEKWWSISQ